MFELGLCFAEADVTVRVAASFGDQRALVVSRGIDAKIAERTPQPVGEGESVVAIPAIALKQWTNQHFHIEHVLLV